MNTRETASATATKCMLSDEFLVACIMLVTTRRTRKISGTSRPGATRTQVLCRSALKYVLIVSVSRQYLGISSHNIKNSPLLARLRRKICRRTWIYTRIISHNNRDLVKYLNDTLDWFHVQERAHILMSGARSWFGSVIIALGLAPVERKAAKCK